MNDYIWTGSAPLTRSQLKTHHKACLRMQDEYMCLSNLPSTYACENYIKPSKGDSDDN
jgi:hypothetical protein